MSRTIISLSLVLIALTPVAAFGQGASPGGAHSTPLEILGARPFLEASYGMATPQFKGSDIDFETVGLLDFKLGWVALDSIHPGVTSLMQSYIFGSWANGDLGSSGSETDVGSKLNRFGGGNRLGYGYQGQSVGLDLYNQNSLNWSKFTSADDPVLNAEAAAVFDRYGSKYRFGQIMEAGAGLRFTDRFALTAGAEGSIIYPRYVFWPWLGSTLIYSTVQGIVEYFADDVMRANAGLGPVLYFLLKSGVSAGFYALSREDMNWPFSSEKPVTVATWRVGASFTF